MVFHNIIHLISINRSTAYYSSDEIFKEALYNAFLDILSKSSNQDSVSLPADFGNDIDLTMESALNAIC